MDTQKHISSAFDQDLTILNDSLQQLGDLACQQLEGAIEGLAMQNQANLDTVIKGDAALDALEAEINEKAIEVIACLLYTSPSPRDRTRSRMPSSA